MTNAIKIIMALFMTGVFFMTELDAQTTITPLKNRYQYKCGEKAVMELFVLNKTDKTPLKKGVIKVTVTKDNHEVLREFSFDMAKGNPVRFEITSDKPGILWLKSGIMMNGICFEPDKLRQGYPEPADFDAFWQNLRKKQAAVNDPVKVFPLPENTVAGYDCFKLAIRVFSGRDIYGFLTVPKGKKGPFNGYVQVIAAGSGYPGPESTFIRQDTISMGLNVHSFDPADAKTKYDPNYMLQNVEDRDNYYFRDAILAACTAVEWLAERKDFNGTMVYLGASQGGGMGIITEALTKKYKALAVAVPALCDMGGSLAGHGAGWPDPVRKLALNDPAKAKRIIQAAAYYDAANFAKRIPSSCPVMFSVGMIDVTCAPASVYAAYNNVPGPKWIMPCPKEGHPVPWEALDGLWQWVQNFLHDDSCRTYLDFYRW